MRDEAAGDGCANDDATERDDDDNPIESEPADETDEIEKDGQKYRIPKALKDNFLMHRDYTHKTQALAEKERQIDATIAMLNAMYDRDGGLGDEFSPL